MDFQSVTSSTIERVGYDRQSMTLAVEFRNGTVYEYYDVPETVFAEFLAAGSPGQYLSQHVKKSYRYART